MKITDLLTKESIDLNVKASNKKDVIEQAVELMEQNGNLNNKQEYLRLVMKREEEGSTGVGEEIAIPHGKGESISEPGLAAMVIPEGVDFDSLDGKPIKPMIKGLLTYPIFMGSWLLINIKCLFQMKIMLWG